MHQSNKGKSERKHERKNKCNNSHSLGFEPGTPDQAYDRVNISQY